MISNPWKFPEKTKLILSLVCLEGLNAKETSTLTGELEAQVAVLYTSAVAELYKVLTIH